MHRHPDRVRWHHPRIWAAAISAAACAAPIAMSAALPPAAAALPAALAALVSDPASLVNPMIGTGSGGAVVGQIDTFPGAAAPFGMLSFSPDTGDGRLSPASPNGHDRAGRPVRERGKHRAHDAIHQQLTAAFAERKLGHWRCGRLRSR